MNSLCMDVVDGESHVTVMFVVPINHMLPCGLNLPT